jgi:(p)ppGpp synthase/HD superfamily hydrolase
MKLEIGGRKIFDSIASERENKIISLCQASEFSEARFRRALKQYGRSNDILFQALDFAKSLNFSKSSLKSSYLSHPIRVGTFLLEIDPAIEDDYLVTSVLHNVPEVSDVTIAALDEKFGKNVSDNIRTLLVNRKAVFAEIEERYYHAIFAAGEKLMLVKLLDKMDNLFVLCLNPNDEARNAYLEEIRRVLLPFALRFNKDLGNYLLHLIDDATATAFSADLKKRLDSYQKSQAVK